MGEKNSKLIGVLLEKGRIIFRKYYVPRWLVFFNDSVLVFITFLFAYLLRFNFVLTAFSFKLALAQAIFTLIIYSFFSLVFKSYSGLIRHTTIKDIYKVVSCNTFSLVVLILFSSLGRNLSLNSIFVIGISILVIHFGMLSVILFLVRVLIKMTFEFLTLPPGTRKNVLIFGADSTAILVNKIIQTDNSHGYRIIGLIDDDKKLHGKEMEGMRVYSPRILLSLSFLTKNSIKVLIIAEPDITPRRKSELIQMALVHNLEVLETPKFHNLLRGSFGVKDLQKVKLEDLLGREQIKLDMNRLEMELTGKTIMVTGAAGSIGSEITRQLTKFNAKKLVLVDQAETPLFFLDKELKEELKYTAHQIILSDITNRDRINNVFREFSPEIVFHAAAYKHVSMMEEHPQEAIHVNVGGTKIMADLAIEHQVSKFVMVSSDKAVNPSNIMGASKRICELYIQAQANKPDIKTQFVTTRFGNVLGSNGSVIPLFSKQIKSGGPVLVTHPEVTRYFMTIPEACQLVLEAGFMGRGGEIFVFDMGKPIKIRELAEHMIKLSGYVPGVDIKIEFIGLRSGEKLYEEVLADKDTTLPTHHPKIMIARGYKEDYQLLAFNINNLLKKLYLKNAIQVVLEMMHIVPEFQSNNEKFKYSDKEVHGFFESQKLHQKGKMDLRSDQPSSPRSSKRGA